MWRASVSELLGTAVLVFMIDTINISSNETNTQVPKLINAIFVSITVAILVLATVPVSGGHINPTVTLSAGLMGVVCLERAIIYILAQCIGGIIGALALKSVISKEMEQTFSLGGCTITRPHESITSGLHITQAISLEIFCSFSFLFASRWIAFDQRQAKMVGRVIVCSVIGISAGLNVFVSTTITGVKEYSGAGMNPARCFGPAVVRGGHLWNGHWVFWVGPFVASMLFFLYTKLIPHQHFQPEETRHDLFSVLKGILVSNDADGHFKNSDEADLV